MANQPDPALPLRIRSLTPRLLNHKLRIAGRLLSYDHNSQLILLQDGASHAVLVDVSLCVNPAVALPELRESKSIVTVIGHLEVAQTELPVPRLPAFVDAPHLNPSLVLHAILLVPSPDLDLALWHDSIQKREDFIGVLHELRVQYHPDKKILREVRHRNNVGAAVLAQRPIIKYHHGRIPENRVWKKEKTADLVIGAVLQGFRAIDTAKALPVRSEPQRTVLSGIDGAVTHSEDLVGDALQVLYSKHGIKRDDLWIQSKFTSIAGQDTAQPLPYDPALPVAEQVRASFARSLANLRTDHLDALLLHSPLATLPATLAAWRALCALQDRGAVRCVGVCNAYDVATLQALADVRPVQIVQNRWHAGNRWDRDVCAYCRERGIVYQTFWTLTGSPGLLTHPATLALARHHDRTPAQIVFMLAQKHGLVPLAGSTHTGRMRDGVDAASTAIADGKDAAELAAITGLDTGCEAGVGGMNECSITL